MSYMTICHRTSSGFRRFGTAIAVVLGMFVLLPAGSFAQTYTETILHNFSGAPNDGAVPTSGLVLDSGGNLYGTTYFGGTSSNYGTVYKVTTTGIETVLYSFSGSNGANPVSAVLRDSKGNLYGTTQNGGTLGYGTVFKLTANNVESVLYNFSNQSDGGLPFAGLAMDKNGNFYGSTTFGGFDGVLYKLTSSDVETQLHSFTGEPDGMFPFSGVVLDSAGNLYGTSSVGGNTCPDLGAFGCGVVYEYSSSAQFSILYAFSGPDGQYPYYGSLVRDSSGNLYGTTYQGGKFGYGTVFKLTPAGVETVLHSFSGGADGAFPLGGLIEDASGNFYGTTYQGGSSQRGTVFRLTSSGIKTILHNFTSTNQDGAYPMSKLVRDSKGNLYGTTEAGGSSGLGIVFKLTP